MRAPANWYICHLREAFFLSTESCSSAKNKPEPSSGNRQVFQPADLHKSYATVRGLTCGLDQEPLVSWDTGRAVTLYKPVDVQPHVDYNPDKRYSAGFWTTIIKEKRGKSIVNQFKADITTRPSSRHTSIVRIRRTRVLNSTDPLGGVQSNFD